MWFRNLQLYRLQAPFELTPEQLHEELAAKAFKPCAGLDTHRIGWAPPLGRHGEQLVHATNGRLMVCLRREERILPAAVVNEAVAEKVEAIEETEARQVGRKEKSRLKEETVVDLLPRAFTRSSHLFAYIDPADGWIVVDNSSANRAEELLSLLRETLGSLKVKPLGVAQAPAQVMTAWLVDGAPAQVEITDECELKEPVEDGAIIRCKRVDLGGDEVKVHLDAGKQVTRLAVEWNERVACVLSDDLVVRRLRFMDLVLEEAAETEADDAIARFDADFALMAMELGRFLPWVVEVFGGFEEEA